MCFWPSAYRWRWPTALSGENTPAQVAHIAETVPRVVAYLRSISPVWEQMQNEKA